MGNVPGVLHNHNVRAPGLFIGARQLHAVVGLLVDIRFVRVVRQKGLFPNHHIGDHILRFPQRPPGSIVIKHIDTACVQQGLLQRPFDDIQARLILFDQGRDRIASVRQIPCGKLAIFCDLPDDVPGLLRIKGIGGIGLEIPQPVVAGHFDHTPSVFALGEHPAVKL